MMFLLPFVFLSGYVFPIDGMPLVFQMLSRVIPARYFIEVVSGIVLRGAGLDELWAARLLAGVLHVRHHRARGLPFQEDGDLNLR